MSQKEIVVLSRDTVAMMVPSGARIFLHEGTEVTITQALGNAFTVNVYGNLARIDSKDADALGREIQNPLQDLPEDATAEDRVWAMLKTVFDPEIPVNIVDLGLVYTCSIKENEDNKYNVSVKMTLTSPGCGMGPVIAADAQNKVASLDEIDEVDIDIVFEPPWERNMMSDVAKLELGVL